MQNTEKQNLANATMGQSMTATSGAGSVPSGPPPGYSAVEPQTKGSIATSPTAPLNPQHTQYSHGGYSHQMSGQQVPLNYGATGPNGPHLQYNIVPVHQLSRGPGLTHCPRPMCPSRQAGYQSGPNMPPGVIYTTTRTSSGLVTWLAAAGVLIFAPLGCCLIPFCINDIKDVIHKCPACKYDIAKYERQGHTSVLA